MRLPLMGHSRDAYWHEVDLKGIKISIEIDEVSIEGILE